MKFIAKVREANTGPNAVMVKVRGEIYARARVRGGGGRGCNLDVFLTDGDGQWTL